MGIRAIRTSAAGAVLSAATAAIACALGGPDEEARRAELVARLERSVVVVLAEGHEISREEKRLASRATEGLGTGVVLSAEGLVLTAAHVVSAADRVRIKVEDAEPTDARVVFSDEAADVALLHLAKVPARLLPATLGNSDRVRKGETVYVIGNPVGIEHSLSAGVVSGRHSARHIFGGSVEADLIQTDAAINAGNSGGPMFNSRGEVIAIAQSILTQGGGSEGLGFGLAINAVKKILALDPCVWLGFSGVSLAPAWASALNVPGQDTILVERVTPGGPADTAGLRGGTLPGQLGGEVLLLGGDVILKIGGRPPMQWIRSLGRAGLVSGESHDVGLTILREGQIQELTVVAVHRKGW